ncbi:MAG TPA: hypothetical protein VF904_11985 [Anaeromyxobacteraceae bacterium]
MKKLLAAVIVLGLATPLAAFAETWKGVTLIDRSCGAKFKANPDNHPAECLKKCAKASGLGIITSEGTWLKLDEAGNKQAIAALDKSTKKDHIRFDVTGEKSGETVKVESLKVLD